MRPHRQSSCLRARGWTERGSFESRERLPIFCAPARFRQGHRDRRTRSSLRNPNELQSRRGRRPAADGEKDCLRAYAEKDEQAAGSEANFNQRIGSDAGKRRFPTARGMGGRGGRETILHAREQPASWGRLQHPSGIRWPRASARRERDGYYIQFRAARNPDRFKRRQDAGWTYSHSVTS